MYVYIDTKQIHTTLYSRFIFEKKKKKKKKKKTKTKTKKKKKNALLPTPPRENNDDFWGVRARGRAPPAFG